MKIKRGEKRDSAELTRLYCSIWPKEIPKRVKNYFFSKIKAKEVFIAVEDNKIIGILSFTKSWWKGADYLDEVVVHKNYRGRGIAAKLMLAFEKDAKRRKARRIFSSTQPLNRVSIKLQQKAGFRRCGYVDDMFEEGQRELIFSKKI